MLIFQNICLKYVYMFLFWNTWLTCLYVYILEFWNICNSPNILTRGTLPDGNIDLGCGNICYLRVPHFPRNHSLVSTAIHNFNKLWKNTLFCLKLSTSGFPRFVSDSPTENSLVYNLWKKT